VPPGDVPAEGLAERRNRPGIVLGAAAATALVITVLNNLGAGAGSTGFPRPDHTLLPSPAPTLVGIVHVPRLVPLPESTGLGLLENRGLSGEVLHRFVPCNPAGVVVGQDPPDGTVVHLGEDVTVVVTDPSSEKLSCPEGIALDADRAVADALFDFSRGVAPGPPPVAAPVWLGVFGAEPAVALSGREADHLGRWRTRTFGGSGDPVPLLDVLARSDGAYRVDVGPHRDCTGSVRAPANAFAWLRQVSITPTTPPESCRGWWAVDLFLDDTGRIGGINLDLGGP
jgi:hypothetical protein